MSGGGRDRNQLEFILPTQDALCARGGEISFQATATEVIVSIGHGAWVGHSHSHSHGQGYGPSVSGSARCRHSSMSANVPRLSIPATIFSAMALAPPEAGPNSVVKMS